MAMNKQRKNSNLINILSYDDAGNIVLRDYSQTIRYNWNGTIHAFTGPLSISSIAAAVTDTDRFLVSDGGVLKYRTGAEVLSDIGGVPSTRTLTINGVTQDLSVNRTFTIAAGITGTGVAGQIAYWNGTNSQTGSNNLFWDAANARLGIGTNSPTVRLDVTASSLSNPVFNVLNTSNPGGAIYLPLFECNGSNLSAGNAGYIAVGRNRATNNQFSLGFWYQGDGSSLNRFDLNFYGTSTLLSVNAAGSVMMGTTTSSGQRLQVQGDAFIRGSGATSATSGLIVQDSASTQIFNVRNDGNVFVGLSNSNLRFTNNGGGTNRKIIQASWSDGVCRGTDLYYNSSSDTSAGNGYGVAIYNSFNTTFTSGEFDNLLLYSTFVPTSGTGRYTHLNIRPVINQTGGANGITRGLYVNPTLTAAADWRSIEWSNNSGWGLYGAGTANNYLGGRLLINTTTVGTFNLDVNGTARVGGPSISAQLYLKGGSGLGQYLYLDNGGSDLWTIIGANVFVIDSSSTRIFRANANAQVTINGSSVNNSAQLQVDSTTRGFLPPRMTTTQKNAIGTPAAGLVVYDNTDNYLSLYNGTNWQNIVSPNSNSNVLIGTASDTGYRLNVNGGIYGKGITADSDGGVGNAIYAYNQVLSGSSNNALVQLSTTWNTTGNAVGIEFNVFNTASGASSRLIDLKVDLVSKFIVYKDGKINASSLPTSATGLGTGDIWNNGGVLNIV
jgi:hypothetical protein